MKFYYSSMFVQEDITNIQDFIAKFGSEKIELILDSNICIYLRDFYKNPSAIISNDKLWNELKGLLYSINTNDLEVDFSLGLEESSRSKSNFEFIEEKLWDSYNVLIELFEMDYLQIIEHSKLIKTHVAIKDTSEKQPSKILALEQEGQFQNHLFLNYACLLKLHILINESNDKSNVVKMIEYLDFLGKKVDVLGAANILFGHLLLSGETRAKKLIHPKNKKSKEEIVHAIWNAAIDLTFPILVTNKFFNKANIPIFVTADERCWRIFNLLKLKAIVTDKIGLALPPFVEMNLSDTLWNEKELREINLYHDKIIERRRFRYISPQNGNELIDKLRLICFDLEKLL